jgi:transcriptional regulator with XRE-family HTH domain
VCEKPIMATKKTKTFADRFDGWIWDARMRGYEVAEKLGVTPGFVSHIRRGRKEPGPQLLQKIERMMKVRRATR